MLTTFPQCKFSPELPEILSQNRKCYNWLSVSGISKIMHCGLLINMPYSIASTIKCDPFLVLYFIFLIITSHNQIQVLTCMVIKHACMAWSKHNRTSAVSPWKIYTCSCWHRRFDLEYQHTQCVYFVSLIQLMQPLIYDSSLKTATATAYCYDYYIGCILCIKSPEELFFDGLKVERKLSPICSVQFESFQKHIESITITIITVWLGLTTPTLKRMEQVW